MNDENDNRSKAIAARITVRGSAALLALLGCFALRGVRSPPAAVSSAQVRKAVSSVAGTGEEFSHIEIQSGAEKALLRPETVNVPFEDASRRLEEKDLIAADDTYIMGGSHSGENYATAQHLISKADGDEDWSRKILLRFHGLPADDFYNPIIQQMKLRLFVVYVQGSARTLTVSRIGPAWDVDKVTWDSFDETTMMKKRGNSFPVAPSDAGQWIEVEVSNLIPVGYRTLELLIEDRGAPEESSLIGFASSENLALEPYLMYDADAQRAMEFRVGYGGFTHCINIPGNNASYGDPVRLHECNGERSQHWIVNGRGQIKSVLNHDVCLAMLTHKRVGSPIVLHKCRNWPEQQWKLTDQGEIKSMYERTKCIDLQWSKLGDGSKIHIWDCHEPDSGQENQIWFRPRDIGVA